MMKETYIAPEIEAVEFDSSDIITTSDNRPVRGENETTATYW